MNYLTIIIFLLLTVESFSTVYEDAEDNRSDGWSIYGDSSTTTIRNIYDNERESRVIVLNSQKNQNGYMLEMERDSNAWCKTKGKTLNWSMQTKKHFVVMVSLQTIKGHRYIVYTSGDTNGRGYYGLGGEAIDGEWHTFSRDLDLDLKRYEPTNEIIAFDTFFVRGSMRVDDIEIVNIDQKKEFTPKKLDSCTIKIKLTDSLDIEIPNLKKPKSDRYDTTPPQIKLNGYPILSIKLGEDYIEQGAIAEDNVDGEVNVTISEEIDSNRVGTYTRFYMAKDSVGNTSMTTRTINVGSYSNRVSEKVEQIEEELATLELVEDDYSLEIGLPEEDDY